MRLLRRARARAIRIIMSSGQNNNEGLEAGSYFTSASLRVGGRGGKNHFKFHEEVHYSYRYLPSRLNHCEGFITKLYLSRLSVIITVACY